MPDPEFHITGKRRNQQLEVDIRGFAPAGPFQEARPYWPFSHQKTAKINRQLSLLALLDRLGSHDCDSNGQTPDSALFLPDFVTNTAQYW
jgi:hypothetical protein